MVRFEEESIGHALGNGDSVVPITSLDTLLAKFS